MKVQIRNGVFETNSSMTHSLTICTAQEYDKWYRGELVFDEYHNKFVTPEEAKDDGWDEEGGRYSDYYSEEQWNEDFGYNFETFEDSYTTPNGEKVVAFGYYGHG